MAAGTGPSPRCGSSRVTDVHDAKHSLDLRNALHFDFTHTVKVRNVLSLFMQMRFDEDILTDDDIDEIKATLERMGDIKAAGLLLDCLLQYRPKWFTLLQQVLRHKNVKLSYLAKQFDEYYDKVLDKYMADTVAHYPHIAAHNHSVLVRADFTTSQRPPQQPMGNLNQNNSRPVMRIRPTSPEDDFKLRPGTDEDVSDDDVECDGSTMPRQSKSPLLSDMPKPNPTDSNKTKRNQFDPLPALPTGQVDETMCKAVQSVSLQPSPSPSSSEQSVGYPSGGASADNSASRQGQEEKSRVQHGKKPCSGDKSKDMKDFSFVETEEALSRFDGWHQHQTDKGVIFTFSEILKTGENGHYLIWFWERKKRPAICVSHNGKLITLVIHRKLDKSNLNEDKHIYYVSRDICLPTLEGLFEHHKMEGLPDADLTIQLTHPIIPPK